MIRLIALWALALSGIVGCSNGHKFAPVSGRVTLNGQPLAGVTVDFQPLGSSQNSEPGPGSTAVTDADGRFVLHSQLEKSRQGAVVGKHQVRIWPAEGSQAPDQDAEAVQPKGAKRKLIPGRYHVNSELTFTVPPGGTDQANFELIAP
jgi:hypothetical protein